MTQQLRHIPHGEFVEADPSPGVRRMQAFASDSMWAGTAETAPNVVSGWHHHGDLETAIYVVGGSLRLEFGPGGKSSIEAGEGDFVSIPPGAIHREANPGDTVATLVVVRAGSGPPTINVEGPEPA